LSLSAILPSSGSEPAFIFCITRLRCSFTAAFGNADIMGNLLAQASARDLDHDLAVPAACSVFARLSRPMGRKKSIRAPLSALGKVN